MPTSNSLSTWILYILRVVLLTSDDLWWSIVSVWLVRTILFSFVLRTYLFPWVVGRISPHLRLRSISLRSIRGFYARVGSQTLRAERIRWSWSYVEGSRRITFQVDGLTLHVGTPAHAPVDRHSRALTLADFAPSPMAHRLWTLFSSLYSLVDPFLRPLVRNYFAACLRLLIRWVPGITQALALDLHSPTITFADMPGAKIVISSVSIRTGLTFTQAEKAEEAAQRLKVPSLTRTSYSVAALRRRLTYSMRRSWDHAWGQTHGCAKVELKCHDIVGSMESLANLSGLSVNFFTLPGSIDFDASLGFSPRRGSIDRHSVKLGLVLSEAHVELHAMVAMMDVLKRSRKPVDDEPEPLETPSSPYFRDSLRYPLLSPNMPSFLSSPASPVSPTSPRSPFLGAFSGPVRRRIPPCTKLKQSKDTSSLSFLADSTFRMSKITVTAARSPDDEGESYKVVVHDVAADAKMSDPDITPLHARWLGRGKKIDKLDPDGYAFDLSLGVINMDRNTPFSHTRLLVIKATDFQSLVVQWPSPWLHVSPFISGDPNAPLLAVHARIGAVSLTERLDCLQRLFAHLPRSESKLSEPSSSMLSPAYPVPRLSLESECEEVCARLIVGSKHVDPTALELRTDGFVISVISRFSHRPPRRPPSVNALPLAGFLPLHLHVHATMVLRPVFLRVCAKQSGPASVFAEDSVFLSIEALELTGHCKADASITDDGTPALVDLPSRVLHLHCTTDALCIELWHPLVINTLIQLLASLPMKVENSLRPPSSIVDKLPRGLFATLSLARCVAFVTAPEINTDDTMDLCRGFAIRSTSLSIQYCSLLANPDRHLEWRTSTRQKLYLSPENLLPASLAAARTNSKAVFIGVSLPDVVFRSCVSTRYDADDPLIAERDDPNLKAQEFLHLKKMQAVLTLSSGTFWPIVNVADSCDLSLVVPYIHGDLQLAHMYSILLGVATLKQLVRARPSQHPSRTFTPRSRPLLLKCSITVQTVQIFCALPTQSAVLRFDEIAVISSLNQPLTARWDKAIVLVKVHPTPAGYRLDPEVRWDELARLQKWSATFHDGSIELEADNTRIRIPHGFVIADLILDVSVVAKAVRHLARICILGQYFAMPVPEAEGPKSVPKLVINIRSLCVEAADDPFESKLGAIFQTGLEAARHRQHREEAFAAKVRSILTQETDSSTGNAESPDFNFDAKHSISIADARDRLDEVHSVDWKMRHDLTKHNQALHEERILRKHHGACASRGMSPIPNLVRISHTLPAPPLLRVLLTNITINIAPPSFPVSKLAEFLYEQGNELPLDTKFSLLVPLHLNFALSSLRVTLRDYPLPLVYIPAEIDKTLFVLDFDSDLVVAEEMGTAQSVDWVDCPVVPSDFGLPGAAPFFLSVPKTIMPVKSYANPVIDVTATGATVFSWGVSYGPATQDLMRVVETLSTAPRDSSPGMGFWDKMRLIFHWTIKADFAGEVRYQMKGLRDPYTINGAGAGFVLAWQGNPKLLIAQTNDDKELIQVLSDSMVIAIPDFSFLMPKSKRKPRQEGEHRAFQKICAKFGSGVRFGVGFVMERACGPECSTCSGTAFDRKCRFYDFAPHYDVKLQKKPRIPERKTPEDSYNGFRSDFIHLSTSLTSALNVNSGPNLESSSLHLTPHAFTHFWSWWRLFDVGLPIRQGTAWPTRPISPKFGRHLATLKYRISVKNIYIMHAYIDDSRETWADGATPWIGVKGVIEEFQVDMHQREEESMVPGLLPNSTKRARRKPFYAVELVLKGLDLRAMLATFDDPVKLQVGVTSPPQRSNYRTRTDLPPTAIDSPWIDEDDFIELDWIPSSAPSLHFLPVATCPRFTYFRRAAPTRLHDECSKFGSESTHTCYLDKEPSVIRVQIDLALARVAELKESIKQQKSSGTNDNNVDPQSMEKMLALIEDYIQLLQETDAGSRPMGDANGNGHNYHIPADTLSEAEWSEFDNVYQIHCPKIFLDSAIRDIMMQYYYCSRARRGLEYHLATRAVKFIRDQAEEVSVMAGPDKHRSLGTAQAAAHALRKILSGHERKSVEEPAHDAAIDSNPLDGWFEGVSLKKGHCCLLLKPQIVLRDESVSGRTCVVAAVQAKLQSYAIMDDSNVEDPISGKVMSRTFTSLSGLQTFSPASADYSGDGCVPLEVLIDFRCESVDFERLVPQTDATFHYDKFNRLRLRNNVTSVVRSVSEKPGLGHHNHLHDQTDLIQVNIPQFTVTANDQHFQTISNIVAKLLLFSDAAHKTRLNKLETLLFTYDFNDLKSVATVVTDLQKSLRDATETELMADVAHLTPDTAKLEMLKLKAHKMLLSEDLSGLFDCIKLAQDQRENQSEPKSAVLLHTSSSEISWRMMDDQREMLAKLVVQNIDFFWLSRQDSSTVNNLTVGNLQAFDGSRDAQWAEILSKYDDPGHHPLAKRGLFVLANWAVLAPVGGITIYESFELNFHPMRLQVDAKVGRRIMEYVWPARRDRKRLADEDAQPMPDNNTPEIIPLSRSSLDSPRLPVSKKATLPAPTLAPPMKLSASRSFTDLRSSHSLAATPLPHLHRTLSSSQLRQATTSATPPAPPPLSKKYRSESSNKIAHLLKKTGDAAEMKNRSAQKSFVLVRISSLNLLLSIMKEESFVCRDAHIRTRDLEYRNQTWSFEELVDQFIPSDMSWKGWLKMAFHQPLVPVLPVARELISKTKWIANNKSAGQDINALAPPLKMPRAKAIALGEDEGVRESDRSRSPRWRKPRRRMETPPPAVLPGAVFTFEPEGEGSRPPSRNKMFHLFDRRPKGSTTERLE
ncbi:golgi-body localization protein domain-containing protein [Mycena belliarum]|uniref:Golgi-body localization protein domain-containing protein n=1 Tax=Mycena belliarum TaxID=1033014 RepID=A0AAD6UDM9_9AGAR|nr:golgi-body localization protein domain-containing protein [Mycena belliae]